MIQAAPSDWPIVRLENIADSIQYGYTASAIDRDTGPRFLRITDIQDGSVNWKSVPSCDISAEAMDKFRLQKGDILFARTGGTTGKSFLVEDSPEAVFASYLIRVRVSALADPGYVAAFFQSPSYWSQIHGGMRGIGQPNVNATVLAALRLPLPPINQQRELVNSIDTISTRLDAGHSNLKKAEARLSRYRTSVLKAAVEGRLVTTEASLARESSQPNFESGIELVNRLRVMPQRSTTPPDPSFRIDLPKGWGLASLDELCSVITSGSRAWSKFYGRGTATFVLAQNIRPLRLDFSERQLVDPPVDDPETRRTEIHQDDLLVTIVGARTGDVCRVSLPLDRHFVCQSVALLRPATNLCSSFIELFLASPENGQAIWRRYVYGQGRPHLSFDQLRMTPVPIPPLREQHRIVAEVQQRLSLADSLERALRGAVLRSEALRSSLLSAAFAGKYPSPALTDVALV